MNPVFATDRLDVRPWTHDEVDLMYDIYRRWDVVRWLGASPSVAESADSMHATVDRWASRAEGAYGVWAVVPRDTGVPVGTVLLVPLQDGEGNVVEEVEVGWHFHPDAWGHGYATESARGALDRGWAAGLDVVYAIVLPGNDRSTAVCARLGMQPLGRTDRWYGMDAESFSLRRP